MVWKAGEIADWAEMEMLWADGGGSKAMQNPTSDDDRSACLKKAESCLEQAGQDVSRRTYWIAQAAEWIRRARGDRETEASSKSSDVTHEISDGRLIPKPTTPTTK